MSSLSKQKSLSRDPELDIVRGVAILLAIGWHFNNDVTPLPFDLLLRPGRFIGWAGVDLFFVLSGFLIGRGILGEVQLSGRFRYGAFLLRRLFRLYPVLLLFLLTHVIVNDRPWQSFLPQILLSVQNYTSSSIPILWSLAVEEHFYLITGLTVYFLPRVARTPSIIFPSLASVMVLAFVLRCVAQFDGVNPTAIQWQSQFRMDALAAGLFLAALLQFRPAILDRVLHHRIMLLLAVVMGCVTLLYTEFGGWFGNTVGYTISYATSVAFMLLLFRAKLAPWLRRLSKPIIRLGLWAYPLYIWQFSGSTVANALIKRLPVLDTAAWRVMLTYACAIGIAGAISVVVERPFMHWGKRLTERKLSPARTEIGQS